MGAGDKHVLYDHGLNDDFNALYGGRSRKASSFPDALSYHWKFHRIALLVITGIVVLAAIALILFAVNSGKYVKGTHIGDIDVSGMTVAEAQGALQAHYSPNLEATTMYIFADEKTRDSADLETQLIEASAQAEQLSFEEAKSNEKLWIVSHDTVGASLPCEDLAAAAKSQSDSQGFLQRIGIAGSDINIPIDLTFDDGAVEEVLGKIDEAFGKPMKDYSLEVVDGEVYISKGQKGRLVSRDRFKEDFTDLMLQDDKPIASYVAEFADVPIDISKAKAKKTKKAIEKMVPDDVEFADGSSSVNLDRATLLDWISVKKEKSGDSWRLDPYFESSSAAPDLVASMNDATGGKIESVTMEGKDDGIHVSTSKPLNLYDVDSAMSSLNDGIFGEYASSGNVGEAPKGLVVQLNIASNSSEFTLKDALSYGVVTEFSSYTTRYANTSSTANRTSNIHTAAKKIDGHVAKLGGGQWSFNDTAGPATKEDGYKEANVIDGNEMAQGVGGGICQVATTVFNAVYEAGLPVTTRHNHSLYTSSYPAGRDAAIAYPYLDLVWKNDTNSDILLTASYTDDSITVSLVGIDPERSVATEVGNWEKGSKFSTEYEVDKDLSKDASYVKQTGVDGQNINVERIVKDSEGNVLYTDTFFSEYSPTDRVIAYGKGSDLSKVKEKYASKPKKKKTGGSKKPGAPSADDEDGAGSGSEEENA